jgi:hypothetical protein
MSVFIANNLLKRVEDGMVGALAAAEHAHATLAAEATRTSYSTTWMWSGGSPSRTR